MFRELNKIIRLKRIQKSWTQKKLAQKTGLSQSTICRSEIDCYNIKFGYIVRIIEAITDKNFKFFKKQFMLQDNQLSEFLEFLMEDKRTWALINYDPKRTAVFIIKSVNDNYKNI